MDRGNANNPLKKAAFSGRSLARKALVALLGTAGLAVGLYALIGSIGAPWITDQLLARYTARAPERSALIEAVRFNPFTLKAELAGVEVRDGRSGALLRAEMLDIDIAARSLIERRWVLSDVHVAGAELELDSTERPDALARRLWLDRLERFRIGRLAVAGGTLAAGQDAETRLELTGIELELTAFDGRRTAADSAAGRVALAAETPAGVTVEIDATLFGGFERASGHLDLRGLGIETLAPSLTGIARDVEPRGTVDVAGEFVLASPFERPTLELHDAAIVLDGVELVPVTGFRARLELAAGTADLGLVPAADGVGIYGRVELPQTALTVTDGRMTPPQTFVFSQAAVVMTADAADGFSLNVSGRLADESDAVVMARLPAGPGAEQSITLEATDLPADLLSAYTDQALGRELDEGRADVALSYVLGPDRVTGNLSIVGRDLELVPAPDTAEPDAVSPELAIALLENAEGVIELDLPFAGTGQNVRFAAADALRARLAALTATPLAQVSSDLGEGAVGTVPFLPGEAALGDRALATIEQLAALLATRPRLGIRVRGAHDAEADRTALARQQIQLHVLLATAGPDAQARPRPVDFGSARAQDVLDEFAGERLPPERVEAITRLFECGEGELATLCRRAYYAAIFDALVDNEEITGTSLSRLGRFRAQSIAEALLGSGVAPERIEIAEAGAPLESPFGVGLPVELAVAGAPSEDQGG